MDFTVPLKWYSGVRMLLVFMTHTSVRTLLCSYAMIGVKIIQSCLRFHKTGNCMVSVRNSHLSLTQGFCDHGLYKESIEDCLENLLSSGKGKMNF